MIKRSFGGCFFKIAPMRRDLNLCLRVINTRGNVYRLRLGHDRLEI